MTTLGNGAGTRQAEIRAVGVRDGAYRLVVQSYDRSAGTVPGRSARPVGSLQRAVTADELWQGVRVDLLELREGATAHVASPMVVAWIESGEPDLEFDARTARPQPGMVYGTARSAAGHAVRIDLDRTVMA